MAEVRLQRTAIPQRFEAEDRETVRQAAGEFVAIQVYRELQRINERVAEAGCSIIGNCSGGGSCDIIGNCSSSHVQ